MKKFSTIFIFFLIALAPIFATKNLCNGMQVFAVGKAGKVVVFDGTYSMVDGSLSNGVSLAINFDLLPYVELSSSEEGDGGILNYGVGLSAFNSIVTIRDGKISNCVAGNESTLGIGVAVVGSGEFNMYGGEISHNGFAGTFEENIENYYDESLYRGGGLGIYCISDETLKGHGFYSTQMNVLIDGGKINENSSFKGGGIYVYNVYGITEITFRNGEICDNRAYQGGGVYLDNATETKFSGDYIEKSEDNKIIFNMESGKINGNKQVATLEDYAYSCGGIVAASIGYNTSIYINISGGEICDNCDYNEAWEDYIHMYGGIYGGNCDISGGIIARNGGCGVQCYNFRISKDAVISENIGQDMGGGVYAYGDFIMDGGVIKNNVCDYIGGGVSLQNDFEIEYVINDGEISGNTASYGGGGVSIFSPYATLTMNGGKIINNTSEIYGGGIYFESGMRFVMNGGEISGNSAPYGSAISMYGGSFEYNGGIIDGELGFGPVDISISKEPIMPLQFNFYDGLDDFEENVAGEYLVARLVGIDSIDLSKIVLIGMEDKYLAIKDIDGEKWIVVMSGVGYFNSFQDIEIADLEMVSVLGSRIYTENPNEEKRAKSKAFYFDNKKYYIEPKKIKTI